MILLSPNILIATKQKNRIQQYHIIENRFLEQFSKLHTMTEIYIHKPFTCNLSINNRRSIYIIIQKQKETEIQLPDETYFFKGEHNNYQIYLVYSVQRNTEMEFNTKDDRKSTANSSRGKIYGNHLTAQEIGDIQGNVLNILGAKSSKNINNSPISPRASKKALDLSVSPRRSKAVEEQFEDEREDSIGPSNGSTCRDEDIQRYESIANLTERQNKNLRDQNNYLLQKLRKMQDREAKVKKIYEKAKKYKQMYQEAQTQIQVLKDECQIYKDQADQMKKIILNDVYRLKQKVLQTQITQIRSKQNNNELQPQKLLNNNSTTSTQNKSINVSSQSSLSKYFRNEEF